MAYMYMRLNTVYCETTVYIAKFEEIRTKMFKLGGGVSNEAIPLI